MHGHRAVLIVHSSLLNDFHSSCKPWIFTAIDGNSIDLLNEGKDESSWRSMGVRTILVHVGVSVERRSFFSSNSWIHHVNSSFPCFLDTSEPSLLPHNCLHVHLRMCSCTIIPCYPSILLSRRNSLDRHWSWSMATRETNDVDAIDDGDEAHHIALERMDEARRGGATVWNEGKDVEGHATKQKRRRRAKPTPNQCWCSWARRIHLRGRT